MKEICQVIFVSKGYHDILWTCVKYSKNWENNPDDEFRHSKAFVNLDTYQSIILEYLCWI